MFVPHSTILVEGLVAAGIIGERAVACILPIGRWDVSTAGGRSPASSRLSQPCQRPRSPGRPAWRDALVATLDLNGVATGLRQKGGVNRGPNLTTTTFAVRGRIT